MTARVEIYPSLALLRCGGCPYNITKGHKKMVCCICQESCGGDQFVSSYECHTCGNYHSQTRDIAGSTAWIAQLRGWIHEQNRQGIAPVLDYVAWQRIKQHAKPSVAERVDLLLDDAFGQQAYLGQSLNFNTPRMVAVTYSQNHREVETLIHLCKERGWINYSTNFTEDPHAYDGQLTLRGYIAAEDKKRETAKVAQAFVAMWFDPTMKDARDNGIIPAIESTGYAPMFIDQKEHNRRIDDEIIGEIRRSRFIVADFTHGDDGARGSVYYEAGFAEGLGINVISTCRDDQIADVHFDRRQLNHVLWGTPDELRDRLAARIAAVMGDGPHKGNNDAAVAGPKASSE